LLDNSTNNNPKPKV